MSRAEKTTFGLTSRTMLKKVNVYDYVYLTQSPQHLYTLLYIVVNHIKTSTLLH